jgi:hypothetical protein
MVALLLTTTISCSDALEIINRLGKIVGISNRQRIEIIQVIRQSIPTCPFKIVPDERSKSSS